MDPVQVVTLADELMVALGVFCGVLTFSLGFMVASKGGR